MGSLQNRSYEDKEGIKRTVTDIVASEVEFLTTGNRGDDVAAEPPVRAEKKKLTLQEVDGDDDLPF